MTGGRASNTRAEAVIDHAALRQNVDQLRHALAHDGQASATLLGVVKADAYGHGALPIAKTLRQYGVSWIGVALPEEALSLRAAGDIGRILAWLTVPSDPRIAECVAAEIDLSVGAPWMLDEVRSAALAAGVRARVHLKVDTGLGRGGSSLDSWPEMLELAGRAQGEGSIQVVGIWSHLAAGEDPEHESVALQRSNFAHALQLARDAKISAGLNHIANSGAVLSGAMSGVMTGGDLARSGIAMYGLTPGRVLGDSAQLKLVPVMTLQARLALVKTVPAGQGVSYGHHWIAPAATTLALVPLGYADGIPRSARDAQVFIRGRRKPIVGRIAMDQFVIDLGGDHADPGDEVVVFGTGANGEPTAENWAEWAGTIGYEIVTRIGPRVPRVHEHVEGQIP